MTAIRLQKAIADAGITSRRKAEVLITDGKVTVNGDIVTELGTKVDPSVDTIVVDGTPLTEPTAQKLFYVLLNKPVHYITSTTSEQGESVMELLVPEHCTMPNPPALPRLYPVGRLDKDSEGLLLLTNDGDLTQELTHPSFEHEKEYEVTIEDRLSKDDEHILQKGMILDGTEPVKGIKILSTSNRGKRTIVTVVLTEGKNRQIRRMFGAIGHHVVGLKRTRMNNLRLGALAVGMWKVVTKQDII